MAEAAEDNRQLITSVEAHLSTSSMNLNRSIELSVWMGMHVFPRVEDVFSLNNVPIGFVGEPY